MATPGLSGLPPYRLERTITSNMCALFHTMMVSFTCRSLPQDGRSCRLVLSMKLPRHHRRWISVTIYVGGYHLGAQ